MNNYVENGFDDFLDLDGEVVVYGISFSQSRILKELDPIAYSIGLREYRDLLYAAIENENN